MPARRCLAAATVALVAAVLVTACSATTPGQPTITPTPTPTPTPTVASASPSPTASPTPSDSPEADRGPTLRQLGFENGPVDEFTLPAGAVISTSVDQPNAVTIVLSRPSPQTVEDYLRTTLPDEGFTVDQTAVAGSAMTFEGNGWKGGFTGTAATSAIVLRPA
ncbi:MAG TPA: hypothetical protein VFU98_05380 [Microlunatus sp.]|nr:hypothetical protein [Microlunatus sp.]